MIRTIIAAAILMLAVLTPASAQRAILVAQSQGKLIKVPEARKLVVPVAQLMRVDEGVFELTVGKTIDLTDRKILLNIRCRRGRNQPDCSIYLNGRRSSSATPGARYDLKRERGTAEFVKDKDSCFLDLIDLALPKGAPGLATFRLHCI